MQFRQATVDDAETILRIKQAAIGSIDTEQYTDEQLRAWRPNDDALEDFERAIESDMFVILIGEKDGEPAAYGVLNAFENRIEAIFVLPEYMGEGFASSLVRQFETRARMVGLSELKIVASLNAKSFYEALDYWDFGTKMRSIDGHELEFAIMRKMLDYDDDEAS